MWCDCQRKNEVDEALQARRLGGDSGSQQWPIQGLRDGQYPGFLWRSGDSFHARGMNEEGNCVLGFRPSLLDRFTRFYSPGAAGLIHAPG